MMKGKKYSRVGWAEGENMTRSWTEKVENIDIRRPTATYPFV